MAHLHILETTLSSSQPTGRDPTMIAGYVSWEGRGSRGGKAELVALAVHVDFRGLGFGSQLLGLAIGEALRDGAHELDLQVRPGNVAARSLYSRYGFKDIAVLPKYYGGRDPGTLMRLLLSAEVAANMDMSELVASSRRITGLVSGGLQVSAGSHDAWMMLAQATEHAAPIVELRRWPLQEVVELPSQQNLSRCRFELRGFNPGCGRVLVSVKCCESRRQGAQVAPFKEVLATLLHELAHFAHLGHGAAFYRELGSLVKETASVGDFGQCGDRTELSAKVSTHIAQHELGQRAPTCWRAFFSGSQGN